MSPLPPLAPFPPTNIRLSLGSDEWENCLDAWLILSELSLRLEKPTFEVAARESGSIVTFLVTFYQNSSNGSPGEPALSHRKIQLLRKICFALVKRVILETDAYSPEFLSWEFLSSFCHVHLKVDALRELIAVLWIRRGDALRPTLQKRKNAIIQSLESTASNDPRHVLSQLAALMHASPDIGDFFMTGSDFLDSLISAYKSSNGEQQRKSIVSVAYLGLIDLVSVEQSNTSLLSDHLYSLKAQAEKSTGHPSLLADLITNTSVLFKLRQKIPEKAPDRLFKLLDTLETHRTPSIARPRKHVRKKSSKAKMRQSPQADAMHFHRMGLVTQIQDLFPDLGAGFVLKTLDEYDDDVEQVTAHLLDDTLPPHLAALDRTEPAPSTVPEPQTSIDHLAPRSTPPPPPSAPTIREAFVPERRNVFDTDDLSHHTARLHIGKSNRNDDAAAASNPHSTKAAILSALAAFDSDDDERDDTYDVEDVGGTVDAAQPEHETARSSTTVAAETDATLFRIYRATPDLFGRTFDVRRSQARAGLKAETRMTDEALEGWAVMLARDPRRMRRLEAQIGAFDGTQTALASTAYRDGTETEDSDAGASSSTQQGSRGGARGGGRGRGRGGRGGGGRGRSGGDVAGASNDAATAAAQRRKEANKSSRANHNRRDQRARKMARGGFSG